MSTYSVIPSSVEVVFFGPTNTRGPRVKITCHHLKKSKVVDYDQRFSDMESVAVEALFPGKYPDARMSAPSVLFSQTAKGSIILFTDSDAWDIVKQFFGIKG